MNNLMIDVETFGTVPGCAIRSIGACFFNWDEIGESFYTNIDTPSCLEAGLHIDPRTKAWWDNQAKAAKDALEADQKPLKTALQDFRRWVITNTGDKAQLQVWSHGLSFDIPIINYAQAQLRLYTVWNYYNERDTRTMIWLANPEEIVFIGTAHNALYDAQHQARQMQACYKKLRP